MYGQTKTKRIHLRVTEDVAAEIKSLTAQADALCKKHHCGWNSIGMTNVILFALSSTFPQGIFYDTQKLLGDSYTTEQRLKYLARLSRNAKKYARDRRTHKRDR